jgi:hypothetical protein
MKESQHRLEYPKVTELPVVRQITEHDDFGGLALPQKLAEVIDLSANVIEVDFGNHGKAA